ncbi:MAG: hypothetical protein ACK46X_20360 [Candidatus Sericytochromatia bacterium]
MTATATLQGLVAGLSGAAVTDGARIRVRSLAPSHPFDATVDVVHGAYVVNGLPTGVQLEVTATRAGWTRRTRLVTVQGGQAPLPLNFGATSATDPEGAAHFIAPNPEVERVETAQGPAGAVVCKLSLSEPLDAANQRKFADALVLLPIDEATRGDATGALPPALDAVAIAEGPVPANAPYALTSRSASGADPDQVASVSWDAAGQVATFVVPTGAIPASATAWHFYVALQAPAAGGPIADGDGNALGTGPDGVFGRYGEAGTLIGAAFKLGALPTSVPAATPIERWKRTHAAGGVFKPVR